MISLISERFWHERISTSLQGWLWIILVVFQKNLSDTLLQVYEGLHSRIGFVNHLADGFSWTILRCILGDHKVHSQRFIALKAECNSKLAVALTIMEECFLPMVDPRTGIDMIPHVIYSWGWVASHKLFFILAYCCAYLCGWVYCLMLILPHSSKAVVKLATAYMF